MATAPHDLEEFDAELPQIDSIRNAEHRFVRLGRRVVTILTGFLLGQGMSQGISILAGLFLVRRLSVEAYAEFGLATGFQTVFSVLMDLGFASTIVPLVGDRGDDRKLVGRYVRSARRLRNRTYWLLAPVASIAFLAITRRHAWPMRLQILLLVSVLISLYSGGKVSYFSAPLFVFGRLREYYVPQVKSGAARLLSYIILGFTGGLNAWTAAGLSALNITLNGFLIEKASQRYIDWPPTEDPKVDAEMVQYILPASPAIIFSAFQSQISLFLVSFFGGMVNIAEVTALSRIGQIFAVLMTFNTIIIEPFISRQSRTGLVKKYLLLALLAVVALTPLVVVAFLWPRVFILIIGSKYRDVEPLMGWFILASCLSFLGGLLWIMNRARKWVFWSGSILEVILLLSVQSAFLLMIGVRTTRQAVFFGLASACCSVTVHSYVAILGFVKGARVLPDSGAAQGVLTS